MTSPRRWVENENHFHYGVGVRLLGLIAFLLAADEPASLPVAEPTSTSAASAAVPAVAEQPPAAAETTSSPAVEPPTAAAQERLVPQIDVLARQKNQRQKTPGAAYVIESETLLKSLPLTTGEALRKVPGINVLDEEGLGLRPNLGLRGLDPVRSRKVLLLEDGIPLTFAPYGDNASYYHPPIERMERIEVLKGSSQIAYGPHSVGGVINYITSRPPTTPGGFAKLALGNQKYVLGQGRVGGVFGDSGVVLDYMFKQGEGSRLRTFARLHDVNLKTVTTLGDHQALTLRVNYYREDSQISYSGLTLAEYLASPRGNPFYNDALQFNRGGISATHQLTVSSSLKIVTNVYGTTFLRDWWRQSSNSRQRPSDAGDPACVDMSNLNTTCGNEGRLRKYYTAGIEPRLFLDWELFEQKQTLEIGARAHYETQDRVQMNGPFPNSRTGAISEHNFRAVFAVSGFVQNKFQLGDFLIVPGIRFETMNLYRNNRLANGGRGVSGSDQVTAFIPGLGVSYTPMSALTVFASAHRGFAPPRPEDVISDGTGQVVELAAEESVNYELGVRTRPIEGLSLEVAGFVLDFRNQIVAASVAAGQGATLTNGGKTLHAGIESLLRVDGGRLYGSAHNVFAQVAYTYIPLARYVGARNSNIPGFATVSVSGRRLPYSPEHTATASVGYEFTPLSADVRLEIVHVGRQFADDLNTVGSTDDGQRGALPAYTVFNVAASIAVPIIHSQVFVSAKNLFDTLYIVDRTRGILPGMPLTVFGGIRANF